MTTEFTIDELCQCARREVAQRKKVYPRLVRGGRMTAEESERQIEGTVPKRRRFSQDTAKPPSAILQRFGAESVPG